MVRFLCKSFAPQQEPQQASQLKLRDASMHRAQDQIQGRDIKGAVALAHLSTSKVPWQRGKMKLDALQTLFLRGWLGWIDAYHPDPLPQAEASKVVRALGCCNVVQCCQESTLVFSSFSPSLPPSLPLSLSPSLPPSGLCMFKLITSETSLPGVAQLPRSNNFKRVGNSSEGNKRVKLR